MRSSLIPSEPSEGRAPQDVPQDGLRVSVCMATYNGAAYLKEQLVSICEQLRVGDEVIISDDGSTDGCIGIVETLHATYPHLRLNIVGTTRAGGVVANFERAIAGGTGDVVVLADQDDVWLPGRMVLIREAMRRSDLVVLNGQVVDSALGLRGVSIFDMIGIRSGFWSNLARNSFIGCCMAFRRDIRDQVLPFPVGVPWHDWYIGLYAELVGRVERIDDLTLLYRRHGGNHSPTGEKSANGLVKKLTMRFFVARAVCVALLRSRS